MVSVLSLTPQANTNNVLAGGSLVISFDQSINSATVNTSTILISGSLSGAIAGSFSTSGGSVTFTPSSDLTPGELVSVIVTDGVQDLSSNPADPYFYSVRIGVSTSTGRFLDSGQALGSGDSLGVSLGDLDGDGDLDAFLANAFGPTNQVWLNDGSGNFTDSGQSLGTSDSSEVALGDIDGDGDLDAFISNANYGLSTAAPDEIWLNDGSGNFSFDQSFGNSGSTDVELGDIDGDGDLDAFVTNTDPLGAGADRIWLNDGSGNFVGGQSLGSSDSSAVSLGDLDGDGDLDAFVSNATFNVSLSGVTVSGGANQIWINSGSGNFSSGQTLGNGTSTDVSLGDIDGDGDLDAFVANYSANRVWLNDGSANFTDSGQSLGSNNSASVDLADLDGDGDLDAFVTNGGSQPNRVWLNDGSGNFTDSGQSLGSSQGLDASLGDLNGDGDLDAFVANDGASRVWFNNAAPAFSSAASVNVAENTTAVTTVTATDNDGDTVTFALSGGADQSFFSVNANTGVLSFNAAPDFEAPADNNGDNAYEVAVTANDGNGGSATQTLTVTVTDVADSSLPTTAPLFWRNAASGRTAYWELDSGSLDFGNFLNNVGDPSWYVGSVGDLDGDGKSDDALWRNADSGQNAAWFLEGGTLQSGVLDYAVVASLGSPDWEISGLGDFDGLGKIDDIVYRNASTGENTIVTTNSGNNATRGDFLTIDDLNWDLGGVGSFDSDGNVDDLAWHNADTGDIAIWSMNSSGQLDTGDFLVYGAAVASGLPGVNAGDRVSLADANWELSGVSNLNNDGISNELLWRNESLGLTAFWSVDGNELVEAGFITPEVGQGWTVTTGAVV